MRRCFATSVPHSQMLHSLCPCGGHGRGHGRGRALAHGRGRGRALAHGRGRGVRLRGGRRRGRRGGRGRGCGIASIARRACGCRRACRRPSGGQNSSLRASLVQIAAFCARRGGAGVGGVKCGHRSVVRGHRVSCAVPKVANRPKPPYSMYILVYSNLLLLGSGNHSRLQLFSRLDLLQRCAVLPLLPKRGHLHRGLCVSVVGLPRGEDVGG